MSFALFRFIAKVLIFCFYRKTSKCLQYGRKNIIFAITISATPLYNAYQGGTYFYTPMETYTKQPISIVDQNGNVEKQGTSV